MKDFVETAREIEKENGIETTKNFLAGFCDFLLQKTHRQKIVIASLISLEAITAIAFFLYAVLF